MRSLAILLAVSGIALPAAWVQAQKAPGNPAEYGIFQSQEEYYQFMGDVKSNPEMRSMVDVINDIVLQRPMGSTSKEFGSSGSSLGLLSNPQVRQELEMMDDQYEKLQQVNSEIQQRAATQLRSLDFKNRDDLVNQIQKIREQAAEELNAVLLPHQMERLRQLQSQTQLRGRNFAEVITSEPYKTDLQISDRQSKELRDTQREIEEQLQKDIAELQEKARQKLLSRLKKSQRDQVQMIFGETFVFASDSKSGRRKSTEK